MMPPDASKPADAVKEGLYELVHHWRGADITPAIITLSSPRDFAILKHSLGPELMLMPRHVAENADVFNQVEFMGVIIRAPAERWALPTGGFEWR